MRPGLKNAATESRARRFDLCLPVSYRIGNEQQWRTGITQSISATGALIRARQSAGAAAAHDGTARQGSGRPERQSNGAGEEPVAPADPIVVAISLPVGPGCLIGRGRIVRTLAPGVHTGETTFAVMVDRFRIGRLRMHA